jgi:hypothetical protein
MDMQPTAEVSQPAGDFNGRLEAWLQSDDDAPESAPTESDAGDETGESAPDQSLEAESEDARQEEAEQEDEAVLELDGEEVKLPKDVAEKVQTIKKRLEADYTRKTQEAAEMKRNAIGLQQQLQTQAQFQQSHLAELVQFQSVVNQLKQYDNVDWQALADQDIVTFTKHKEIRDQLRYQAQAMQGDLVQKQQESEGMRAQAIQQARKVCIETVQNALPNYDAAMDAKAVSAAERLAKKFRLPFDVNSLSQSIDPMTWIGLTELAKYYELLDKRGEVKKQVADTPKLGVKANVQKPNESRDAKRRALLKAGRIREAAALT